MSHVVVAENAQTRITNIPALKLACEAMGLRLLTAEETCRELDRACTMDTKTGRKNGHYRSWKDDHGGRLFGDYPTPQGMTEHEVGDNADYVIRPPHGKDNEYGAPYEVGLVWNATDKCYYPAHDFYGGGLGLCEHIAKPGRITNEAERYGRLMMFYQAMESRLAAAQEGYAWEIKEVGGALHVTTQNLERVEVHA